ncbi:MAG: D-alanine--poly(phosphoribitol) ligase subunit DltA [Terrimicrobiaceae bacterium]|nr:D-alanine--poly(phosphoribitol) ligase subunit DltA [Terrimicrobiaceae bacterium]
MLTTPADFLGRIEAFAKRSPDEIAYTNGAESITRGALWTTALRLAAHFRTLPGGSKAPILLIGHKEPGMLAGFLGAAMAGRAYVPVDDQLPAERLERIRQVVQPVAELTPAAIREIAIGPLERTTACPAELDDPFYILFTSGSTGEPKGVVITWRCVFSFLNWLIAEQRFEPECETFLGQTPFTFDVSVMDLYPSLLLGGRHVSIPRHILAAPKELFALLERTNPTVWVSTPSFAAYCAAEPRLQQALLPRLRRFLFCGEALPHQLASQLLDRFPDAEVWNTYGPTEATVAVTSIRVTRELLARHETVPLGGAMPGVRVYAGGPDRRPVADGERAELLIAGPSVGLGYLGRPDLTAERFFEIDGLRGYATGDLASARDGLLFFHGRMDHQVKIGGHRIELEDVEANLRQLAGVSNAVVLPLRRDGQVEGMAAFVLATGRNGESDFELSQRLRRDLASSLPGYMIPKKWIFREAFPTNANGKADRKALQADLETPARA